MYKGTLFRRCTLFRIYKSDQLFDLKRAQKLRIKNTVNEQTTNSTAGYVQYPYVCNSRPSILISDKAVTQLIRYKHKKVSDAQQKQY